MANINYDDPRFQRALLRQHAKSGTTGVQNTRGLTSAFAYEEGRRNLQFAQMQQQRELAYQALELRKHISSSQLGLDEQRLAMQGSQFNRQMKSNQDAAFYGLIGGLGTAIYAGYEGHQRKKDEREYAQSQRELTAAIKTKLGVK